MNLVFVSKHKCNYLLSGSESAITEQCSGVLHASGIWRKFFKESTRLDFNV